MHCIQPAIYANQVQVIQRLRFSSNARICQWVTYALRHPVEMIPWYPKALQKLDLGRCKQKIWTWGQICGTQPVPQGQQLPPLPAGVRPLPGDIGWYEARFPPYPGRELHPWSQATRAQREDIKPYVDIVMVCAPLCDITLKEQ